MTSVPEGYALEVVWNRISDASAEDLAAFWVENKALPSLDAARHRTKQAALLARGSDGRIVGVTTAFARFHEPLNHRFWVYRVFVAAPHRRKGLSKTLVVGLRDLLEAAFLAGDRECIGLLGEMESPHYVRRADAVWLPEKLTFVGRTRRGAPIRIYYFEGAQVR